MRAFLHAAAIWLVVGAVLIAEAAPARAEPVVIRPEPIVRFIQPGEAVTGVPAAAFWSGSVENAGLELVQGAGPFAGTVTFDQSARTFSYVPDSSPVLVDRFVIRAALGPGVADVRYKAVVIRRGQSVSGSGTVTGTNGSDLLAGGPGDDTLIGNPGVPSMRVIATGGGKGAEGGNGGPVASPDGLFVAVVADLAEVLADQGYPSRLAVFRVDLATGQKTLVSAAAGGPGAPVLPADADARFPVFSPDGTRILFQSRASNLDGASGGFWQVFETNLVSGEVRMISRAAGLAGAPGDGDSGTASYAPDGRRIVFASKAENLGPASVAAVKDIFVRDLDTGDVALVSGGPGPAVGDGDSDHPVFSPDGEWVAFESESFGFDVNVFFPATNVFAKKVSDPDSPVLLVSSTIQNGQVLSGDGDSLDPAFSPDGSQIVFASQADHFGGNPSYFNIFTKAFRQPGAIPVLESTGPAGDADGDSRHPSFAPDGNALIVQTFAPNVAGVPAAEGQIVRKDLVGSGSANPFRLLSTSLASSSIGGDGRHDHPSFTPDGVHALFESNSGNLVASGNTPGASDAYIREAVPVPPMGTDTAVYPGPPWRYQLQPAGAGLQIKDLRTAGGDQGTDGLVGISWLKFDVGAPISIGDGLPVNRAPVKVTEEAKAKPGTPVTVQVASDPDGDEVAFMTLAPPQHGVMLGQTAGGSVTYAPDPATTATFDVFTVAASDPYGGSIPVQVVVNIGQTLAGTPSDDQLFGEAGDDTLVAGNGADLLDGGPGNDALAGEDGNDSLFGGLGNDLLDGGGGIDQTTGNAGDDTYRVDREADVVVEQPGEGTDTVLSLAPVFTLPANVEDLTLLGLGDIGGAGNSLPNRITGNAGSNVLSGGPGNDTIKGGPGDDRIEGGPGADSLAGEGGSDTLSFLGSPSGVTASLALSSVAADAVSDFENLLGSSFSDRLTGTDGRNRIAGGAGNDVLHGRKGADRLSGGPGADQFVYGALEDSPPATASASTTGAGPDTVADFDSARGDRLVLVLDLSTRPDRQGFAYIGTARAFSGRARQLRFWRGILLGDANGDRRADFEIRLPGVTALPAFALRL